MICSNTDWKKTALMAFGETFQNCMHANSLRSKLGFLISQILFSCVSSSKQWLNYYTTCFNPSFKVGGWGGGGGKNPL